MRHRPQMASMVPAHSDGAIVNYKGLIMDTVLWGGLAFLIAAGAVFFISGKLDTIEMADRHRRLINYALLGGLAVAAILIFRWHSATYLAANL